MTKYVSVGLSMGVIAVPFPKQMSEHFFFILSLEKYFSWIHFSLVGFNGIHYLAMEMRQSNFPPILIMADKPEYLLLQLKPSKAKITSILLLLCQEHTAPSRTTTST